MKFKQIIASASRTSLRSQTSTYQHFVKPKYSASFIYQVHTKPDLIFRSNLAYSNNTKTLTLNTTNIVKQYSVVANNKNILLGKYCGANLLSNNFSYSSYKHTKSSENADRLEAVSKCNKSEDSSDPGKQESEGNDAGQNTTDIYARLIAAGSLIVAVGGFLLGLYNTSQTNKDRKKNKLEKEGLKLEKEIEAIQKDLNNIVENYTRDHASDSGVKQSNTALDSINVILDKVLGKNADSKVKDYFNGNMEISGKKITLDTILKLSYCCNIWSTNFMQKKQKGEEAFEKLDAVQNIIECYLAKQDSSINIQKLMDNKDYNEIYNQLKTYVDLPQILATLFYLKGRTHIYDKTYISGEKYFEVAKFLGNKTKTLEGVLAQREGLGVIDDVRHAEAIKKGDFSLAKKYLNKNNKLYIKLMNDSCEYKSDYSPGGGYKDCSPNMDKINFIKCSKRIMKNYSVLIKLSNNDEEKQKIVESIKGFLIESNTSFSYIDVLEENSNQILKLSDREKASGYNFLGNVLFELIEQDINIDVIRNVLKIKGIPGPYDNISIVKTLFTKAKNLSSNKDYTKANAENGLANIEMFEAITKDGSQKQKSTNEFTQNSYKTIKNITDHIKARNAINDLLSRKESYKDQKICSELSKLIGSYNNDNYNNQHINDCKVMIGSVCSEFTNDVEQ